MTQRMKPHDIMSVSDDMSGRTGIRGDMMLVFIVAAAALAIYISGYVYNRGSGAFATVTVDGRRMSRIPLSADGEYEFEGYGGGRNILRISEGGCEMIHADCPDGICIQTGRIDRPGESIICMPHRLMVSIEGDAVIDAVSE